MKLNQKSLIQDAYIPVRIFKGNAVFFAEYADVFFNNIIGSSKLFSLLKLANITLVFKRGTNKQKDNHRPVTILLILSKIVANISSKQLFL